jgi:hypothetical protein
MDDPADDSVGFHLAKLLDEHLLGNGIARPRFKKRSTLPPL